jgi:hypothetical protein
MLDQVLRRTLRQATATAFCTDTGAVSALTTTRYLQPALIIDADSIFAPNVTRVQGQGTQHRRPTVGVSDAEIL